MNVKWIKIIVLVAGLWLAQLPRAYEIVTTPPAENMLPLNTAVYLTVWMGDLQPHIRPGHVAGYVVWYLDNRQPEYYIVLDDLQGTETYYPWYFLNRDSFQIEG